MAQNLDFKKLLPGQVRNETLDGLMDNLFNRFVSQEESVFVAGTVGKSQQNQPEITLGNLERQENALIPGITFTAGTEQHVFTFNDLVNKMKSLNVDIASLRNWMSEQVYNFSPPINYDKFVNYANYYWIGKFMPTSTARANVNNDREYYVIELPNDNDPNIKMPVWLATTRNISLWLNDRPAEKITVTFTSATTFSIDSNIAPGKIFTADGLGSSSNPISTEPNNITRVVVMSHDGDIAPAISNTPALEPYELLEFYIVNGSNAFSAGDIIQIDVVHNTSQTSVSVDSPNLIGKGTVNGVSTLAPNMYIDGVQVKLGDRILVKDQNDPSENGIYVVTTGSRWVRAYDSNESQHFIPGQRIYVINGQQNVLQTFEVSSVLNASSPVDSFAAAVTFSKVEPTPENAGINDWQWGNYWVHRDDLWEYEALGVSLNNVEQAQRPIIEYSNTLKLNGAFNKYSGEPCDETHEDAIQYVQRKTRFNQVPQFDLYRYDGTHSGKTSGIWFFKENQVFPVDAALRRRAETTSNTDFVFGLGAKDEDGRLLYFKQTGQLTSIWKGGPTAAVVGKPLFSGTISRDGSEVKVESLNPHADSQEWTILFVSATSANVFGSRSGYVGSVSVNASPLTFDDFDLSISNTLTPFQAGEKFTFKINAPASPRYVKKNDDGSIVNYPYRANGFSSGYEADQQADIPVGTWLTPVRMFQNMNRETRTEIAYADFLNHARSVMRNQELFTGSSFGNNNYRDISVDVGLGGKIREFASNFPLLVSMLTQRDISPISIIDFAEQQYNVALSSIDQFILTELTSYITTSGDVPVADIDINSPASIEQIVRLGEYFEKLRSENVNLTEVFSDTTCLVKNWPATLPMMGLVKPVKPGTVLDPELNQWLILHHDGHVSPIAVADNVFNQQLVQTVVKRSDGTMSAGVFFEELPVSLRPYARQLWMQPSTGTVRVFNVTYDTDTDPHTTNSNIIEDGALWYNRSTDTLKVWNANTLSWNASTEPKDNYWVTLAVDVIRNSLVIYIENKLYQSVHTYQQINLDLSNIQYNGEYAEIELARFASKYGYDTYAPDFSSADAFTWNYSNAVLPKVEHGTARWYEIYKQHFSSAGAVNLTRPDIEPWKLGTLAIPAQQEKPTDWDSLYLSTVQPSHFQTNARAVLRSNMATPFMGTPVIDGVQTTSGDRILLAGQNDKTQNGIYVITAGGWVRATDALLHELTVNILEGSAYAGTQWVLTTPEPIIVLVSEIEFEQVRTWKEQMWNDIAAANPGVKLCVNIYNDALLPPYVSPTSAASINALMTTMPVGIDAPYKFGDNGPVELVWRKSLEFLYGAARTAFRVNPLLFLDATWGETYLRANDNLRVERNLQTSLPARKFLMHGERLALPNALSPAQVKERFLNLTNGVTWESSFEGNVDFKVTHCGSTGQGIPGGSATVFSVFVNGTFVDYVFEGLSFSLSYGGVNFEDVTIEDFGIPFELSDTLTISFRKDEVTETIPTTGTDFIYGILGCEGCVADATPDPSIIVESIRFQPTFSFTCGNVKILKGLGQWYTNLLRYSYIDTDVSTSTLAFRAWDMKLVHRLGALIRPDTLTIKTNSGSIPNTGYNVLLKRSVATQSLWISAIRIQLVQIGEKVINSQGRYVPKGRGDDWLFRIEVYNPSHPFIDINVLNTADGAGFYTFNALTKQNTDLEWRQYTDVVSTARLTMPMTISGIQNVINVVYGYVSQLKENNFRTNETDDPLIDEATGRIIDWQLEIEKFIDTVYSGIDAGTAYVLNPFMDKLFLQTPRGLLGRFNESKFIDAYSSQACYDVSSQVISANNLSVIRRDEKSVIYSSLPIFSAHLMIDEYEHAIVLNDKFSADKNSSTIFDQFLGLAADSAVLSYYRQAEQNGKPTFDGYFISGNDVKRNISSNIDAVQNAYDPDKTFSDPNISQHALSLVGFSTKDYFNNIDISPKAQLDFWRGMISAKGTNLAVGAFTQYKAFSKSSVDEFWAYKLASYGDARERTMPEIIIQPNDCIRQFTSLQFYSKNDSTYSPLPLFSQIEANDDSRWFSINDMGTTLRFEAAEVSEMIYANAAGYYKLSNVYHNGDTMSHTIQLAEEMNNANGARVINATTVYIANPGTYVVRGYTWNNQSALSPIKLFDYSAKELEVQIGAWHPAAGIHAYAPLEIVNITAQADPANYNYSTQKIDNPNFMALKPWDSQEVGRVWWDTSTLAYVPYYDAAIFPNRESRNSRWGNLAEWSSVDLYQWTESIYHPSEYDAIAASQEGDSTIDAKVRLSGRVGFKNYYKSNRSVTIRPIAWSNAGSGNANLHPSFSNNADFVVYNSAKSLVSSVGRLQDLQILPGRRFAAWVSESSQPIGEVVIGENVDYDIGSSTGVGEPIITIGAIPNGTINSITITKLPNTSVFGTRIGAITLTAWKQEDQTGFNDDLWFIRMADTDENYEDVNVDNWVSSALTVGEDTKRFDFERFGLRIIVKASSTSNIIYKADLAEAVANPQNDIFVREKINYEQIIELPGDVFGANNPYSWVVWDVPTQAQLNSDMVAPRNKWRPYLGTPIPVTVTPDIVAAMEADTLKLVNGVPIRRFASSWSDWVKLTDTRILQISDGSQTVFQLNEQEIDATRLSVYANGIQIDPSQIVVSGNIVQVVNSQAEGTDMYLLYRAYQPSEAELKFDPTVADDFIPQEWYKVDYEYTRIDIRDTSGNISGSKYYFWVKDKTLPQEGKSMSMAQAANILQYGDSTYMIFSRLLPDDNAHNGAAYDSCAISGLGNIVTKNDSYKLRFLRDFTLRDDPQELKLKNIHTEWALIRERQSSKIPKQLWDAVTNSVCGQDAAGNSLPSASRISYDRKHGTTTRYGFEPGQIFVENTLALATLTNTILNTTLTINIGEQVIVDYITFMQINSSTTEEDIVQRWFSDAATSRNTMNRIYESARASQVNEIFFAILNDALANNYEFTDLFKTSLITVNSSTVVSQQLQAEQADEFF